MRTFTITALTCLSVISACQQTPGYKITGNITGAQDGDTVMLLKFVGWNPDTLAQTVIKNNEFTFTGRQDTADIRYISYIKTEKGKQEANFSLRMGIYKSTSTRNLSRSMSKVLLPMKHGAPSTMKTKRDAARVWIFIGH